MYFEINVLENTHIHSTQNVQKIVQLIIVL